MTTLIRPLLPLFFLLNFSAPKAQGIQNRKVLQQIADSLPQSRFYFVAQGHNNKANTLIEQELLMALNKKYGIRYDILEYAHSAAFLVNEYLDSGEDSLLTFISPQAGFNFIRAIKKYNSTINNTKKIRFYGVDFEGRYNGKYTKKAIEIIAKHTDPIDHRLQTLFGNVINSPDELLQKNLAALRNYISVNEQDCRRILKKYFIDVLLISHAQYNFSSKRDADIYANFKLLYSELLREDKSPGFLSSFGTGHINPKNSKGFAARLSDDRIFKDHFSIIGIQYFNCGFNKEKRMIRSDGSLTFLCKHSIAKFSAIEPGNLESITFLSKTNLEGLACDKAIEKLAGMIIVRNFAATTFWTWE